jgi:hypothetical protein
VARLELDHQEHRRAMEGLTRAVSDLTTTIAVLSERIKHIGDDAREAQPTPPPASSIPVPQTPAQTGVVAALAAAAGALVTEIARRAGWN